VVSRVPQGLVTTAVGPWPTFRHRSGRRTLL
jgi:hypothetical protein